MNETNENGTLSLEMTPPLGRFFRRLDWSAFWTVLLISFAVYFYSLPPSLTLEDSGELAVAGDYLGVPHPPGYPMWSMIAYGFARTFAFVKYLGQPNPAWGIALMSAVFGALASAIIAMLICRSGSDLLRRFKQDDHTIHKRREDTICWIAAVVSALAFAFSPVMWAQSVIIEVYSLNAFFLALILLLAYRWMQRPSDKLLWVTAFVFGLSLTNYYALLLAAVAMVVILMLRDIELFRDFAIAILAFGVGFFVVKLGDMPSMPNFPKPAVFQIPLKDRPDPLAAKVWILIAVVLFIVVVLSIIIDRLKKDHEGRIAYYVGLGLACLTLLACLLSINRPPPHPLHPNMPPPEAFSWSSHYLKFLLCIVGVTWFCTFLKKGRLFAVASTAISISLIIMLRRGVLRGLVHPTEPWFWLWVILNFVLLALIWIMLPRGKTVALTIFFVELGLMAYVYMPIVSDLRNPPMNWGYPRTWAGFLHAVGRKQYAQINYDLRALVFSSHFVGQIGRFLILLRQCFFMPALLLGFLPFTAWRLRVGSKQHIRGLTLAIPAALLCLLFVTIDSVILDNEVPLSILGQELYKIAAFFVILLLGVGGLAMVVSVTRELLFERALNHNASLSDRVTAATVLGGGGLAIIGLLALRLADITRPFRDATNPVSDELRNQLVWSAVLTTGFFIALIAAGIVLNWLMSNNDRFRLEIDRGAVKWILSVLVGFLFMGIVLVAFAELKLDVQDMFIQRVKFISSHAMYTLWIGYGLILGLAVLDQVFKRTETVKTCGLTLALCLPLIPLLQNAYNPRIRDEFGAAEQTLHDFGWQFGNYQLRGAPAIMEELDTEEEPLPNPSFPPPMTDHAIFFGGTDPGRFVPTYMIYSADVRPDVFLITQNALADNTYMNVMRDLYGDKIWIPSGPECREAFRIYYQDVQAGRRKRNAQIKTEGGRIQVSGSAGVMEINGILCDLIFKYNRYKHDFYVEESYQIPWMFPFFTPHGLILKLNSKATPTIAEQTIRDDMDFWDWYVRRLTADRKFIRDVAARKSFSKLRSAIAGIYVHRPQGGQRLVEGEDAFHEARLLYPLSPEANFRVVQEMLLPMSRFTEAIHIMDDLKDLDPHNRNIPSMTNRLYRLRNLQGEILSRQRFLTQELPKMTKRPDFIQLQQQTVIQLAQLLIASGHLGHMGNMNQFDRLVQNAVRVPGATTNFWFEMGKIAASGGRRQACNTALDKYVSLLPSNTPPETVIVAAQLAFAVKDSKKMDQILMNYLNRVQGKIAPPYFLTMAQLYSQAGALDRAALLLTTYNRMQPGNWQAWLDLSVLQFRLGRKDESLKALEQSIRIGGTEARTLIETDPRLVPLYREFKKRMASLPNNRGLPLRSPLVSPIRRPGQDPRTSPLRRP